MKAEIENVTATTPQENAEIINRVLTAIDGLETFEEALKAVQDQIKNVVSFKCGRGGRHIWISNFKNERLIIIK